MTDYFKLKKDTPISEDIPENVALIINDADGNKTYVESGKYVVTEANGTLIPCEEKDLNTHIVRIDSAIRVRDEAIAVAVAEKLEAEEQARIEKEVADSEIIKEEPETIERTIIK